MQPSISLQGAILGPFRSGKYSLWTPACSAQLEVFGLAPSLQQNHKGASHPKLSSVTEVILSEPGYSQCLPAHPSYASGRGRLCLCFCCLLFFLSWEHLRRKKVGTQLALVKMAECVWKTWERNLRRKAKNLLIDSQFSLPAQGTAADCSSLCQLMMVPMALYSDWEMPAWSCLTSLSGACSTLLIFREEAQSKRFMDLPFSFMSSTEQELRGQNHFRLLDNTQKN